MDKQIKEYLITLYWVTLNQLFPDYINYPFEEIKIIVETEGDESDSLNKYADYILRAFWLRYNLEKLQK